MRDSSHLANLPRLPRGLQIHAWNCACSSVLSWCCAVARQVCSVTQKTGGRHVQHEDGLCWDSRSLGLEPNGSTTTHVVGSVFITSVSHDTNCTTTVFSVLTGTKYPHLLSSESPSTSVVRSFQFLGRCPLCLAGPSSSAERMGPYTVHALHTTLMAASHTARCDFTRVPVQMRLRLAIARWSRLFHPCPARRVRQQTTSAPSSHLWCASSWFCKRTSYEQRTKQSCCPWIRWLMDTARKQKQRGKELLM